MAERIPRVGDRLGDVPAGWVVRVSDDVVLVGPKVGYRRSPVALVRSGYHSMRDNDTVVRDIIGRFVGDEWQPYEPPAVLVGDLPLGTQVRFSESPDVWVILETASIFTGRNARSLHFGGGFAAPHEPVSSYRNDDTGWEWVEA